MHDELVKRLDKQADAMYLTRSGLISLAVSQFLDGHEMGRALIDLSVAFKRIADNNAIDDESKAMLQDFERFARTIGDVTSGGVRR